MKPLFFLIFVWLFSFPVFADTTTVLAQPESDRVIKESPYTVTETMDKFESIVSAKGLHVFLRVDHKENAKGVGLEMDEAQVLIFGNPKGGTLIMKQDMAASLDLPLKVAVYQVGKKVFIAYHKPTGLSELYKLQGNKVIPKATEALDKLTSAAIQ